MTFWWRRCLQKRKKYIYPFIYTSCCTYYTYVYKVKSYGIIYVPAFQLILFFLYTILWLKALRLIYDISFLMFGINISFRDFHFDSPKHSDPPSSSSLPIGTWLRGLRGITSGRLKKYKIVWKSSDIRDIKGFKLVNKIVIGNYQVTVINLIKQ